MITNRKQAFARLYAACMDSSVYAFLASTGITETSKIVAINDLVINLKMYGLWNKMKAIYPFVSDTFNLLSYTEDFSNSTWTKNLCTIVANATTAPNGTNTASKLVVDTNLGAHRVTQAITTNASTYTFSIYAKAAELPAILIYNSTNSNGKLYNLSNGTLGSTLGTVTNSTITNAGNGWYRCTVTMPCTAASQTWMVYGSTDATSGYFFTGNGVNGVYIWGSQLEESATATTYQPITTTPAARFVSQFKYNLKDPRDLNAAFRLAFSGTWTYSQQGALPNGVNAYANTYLNPTTVGFTQTDTHISAYLRTDTNGTKVDIGGSYNLFMGVRWANNYNYPINRSNNANGTSSSSIGYFLASRVDNVRDRMFKNGENVANFNTAAVSLDNNTIMISATNGGGLYSDRQTAFNTIGYGLTDTETKNLYTCIQLFQTALNRYIGNPITKVSDVDAQTFVTSAGIYNQTQANAINTLVTDLKGYGIWSKMKAIYPFVSDTYNLLSYTNDYANAYWTKNSITLTQNATTAPDGTNTGNKITETAVTSGHWLKTILSLTAGSTYTISGYFKAAERQYAVLIDDDSGVHTAYFNLLTGTLVSQSGYTGTSITSVGNGWFRCSATRNASSGLSNFYWAISSNGTTYNYLGDGTSGIYTWGFQFEQSSTLSTYQEITTTPANRFASQFKYNLKDPRDADAAFRLAFNGTWTYDKNGATPNGVNAYANTYYLESANATLNSGHISYYSRTNIAENPFMGASNGTTETNIYPNNSGTFYPRVQATNSGVAGLSLNTAAYFIASRTNATEVNGYRNTTKYTVTNATVSLNSLRTYYLGANNDSTVRYNANQTAFATIGDGLNDTEVANLYTAVQKYQTSLNRNV